MWVMKYEMAYMETICYLGHFFGSGRRIVRLVDAKQYANL